MKIALVVALSLFLGVTAWSQVEPDSPTQDGLISAVVAKYCDVYSLDRGKESAFSIGSSAIEDMQKNGIEEIRVFCLDGFVKIFRISPQKERKVMRIQDTGKTEGIIHYADGSESTSKLFYSPVRPVAYVVIKKK